MIATHELVVPRSIPMIFAMVVFLLRILFGSVRRRGAVVSHCYVRYLGERAISFKGALPGFSHVC